jgi:hypothetical protein
MNRWNNVLALLSLATVLAGSAAAGEPGPGNDEAMLKQDLARLQGTWEIRGRMQGRWVRSVQAIQGNQSTVTRYDENGKVLAAHTAQFALSRDGRVRLFTFWNQEFTAGPNKGKTRAERRSFVYRVDANTFYEARGLLVDEPESPGLNLWKRAGERVTTCWSWGTSRSSGLS